MDAIEKGVNDVRGKNKECKGMRYMRIDGSTPAKQRDENVTSFQNDENCRVGGSGSHSEQAEPPSLGQRVEMCPCLLAATAGVLHNPTWACWPV